MPHHPCLPVARLWPAASQGEVPSLSDSWQLPLLRSPHAVPLGGLVGDNIYLVPERVKRLANRIYKWVALRRTPAQVKNEVTVCAMCLVAWRQQGCACDCMRPERRTVEALPTADMLRCILARLLSACRSASLQSSCMASHQVWAPPAPLPCSMCPSRWRTFWPR